MRDFGFGVPPINIAIRERITFTLRFLENGNSGVLWVVHILECTKPKKKNNMGLQQGLTSWWFQPI